MEDLLIYLLGLSVAVQVGYVLIYFLPFAFYKTKNNSALKPVSVIVCAHNEVENLQNLIPALLEQDYPEFELILINDRSWDKTGSYFAEVAHDFPDTQIITVKQTPKGMSPKKYALTLGIKKAKYEYLLFTDADCVPATKNWIKEMQSGYIADTEIVLGYSPYKQEKGFLNQLIRFETLLAGIQYLSFAVKGQAYMGVGRNLSYTKSCFFKNKGFAAHIKTLGGDDDLFVKEAAAGNNVNVVIAEEAQTVSAPKSTYRDWVIQKRRHLSTGKYYKKKDRAKLGLYILSNVLFYLISILLVAVYQQYVVVFALLVIRYIAVYTAYILAARKLKERVSALLLPLLDLAYYLNYLFLGLSVVMFKKTRWK